jgi:hypothetical protein
LKGPKVKRKVKKRKARTRAPQSGEAVGKKGAKKRATSTKAASGTGKRRAESDTGKMATDEESASTELVPVAESPLDPEPEPTVIDLSIDEDEDQEGGLRARLIAEAAALGDEAPTRDDVAPGVPQEGGEPTGNAVSSAAAAAHGSAPTPPGPTPAAADDAAYADESLETTAADAAAEGAPTRPHRPNPDVPTLTPAALAALTAIHRESVARQPGELVLDLGEATTEEERSRILAAALAHAEMQEAIYRVPSESGTRHRWKGTIASSLFLIATLVFVLPPPAILPDPPPRLLPADHVHGVHVALLLQAEQIEAFRTREGRLPDSLDEVPTAIADVRYVKSNNRLYQLVAHTPQGQTIVYDSASPAPEFEPVRATWLPGPETR